MPSLITATFISLLVLSSGAAARPKGCNSKPMQAGKALYFITNEATNAVAAVPIAADGSLSGGTMTPTGGEGSNAIDGSTNQTAQPDGLVSQSSVSIAGNYLFAVNAGSNTLTMMAISASDPTKLTPLGDPVAVPGEFPNTVAASAKNRVVCVGTTGAKAGVSCASFSRKGLGAMDGLRAFDLAQSTPPVGPTNTVSQVFFSEDESTLFTTVKGDPTVNNTGFLSAFAVDACGKNGEAAAVAQKDVRSSPDGTAVLFGSLPIPGTDNVFVTDASFGGAVLAVDDKDQSSLVAAQPIDGQAATCWVAISDVTKTAFVTDVAVPRLVEMSLDDASILGQLDLTGTGATGLIDLKAAGSFIYALAPGNGTVDAQVLVVDVSGGSGQSKLAQSFGLGKLGAGANSQGMAVMV